MNNNVTQPYVRLLRGIEAEALGKAPRFCRLSGLSDKQMQAHAEKLAAAVANQVAIEFADLLDALSRHRAS